jgi:hypothetical protein
VGRVTEPHEWYGGGRASRGQIHKRRQQVRERGREEAVLTGAATGTSAAAAAVDMVREWVSVADGRAAEGRQAGEVWY